MFLISSTVNLPKFVVRTPPPPFSKMSACCVMTLPIAAFKSPSNALLPALQRALGLPRPSFWHVDWTGGGVAGTVVGVVGSVVGGVLAVGDDDLPQVITATTSSAGTTARTNDAIFIM